MIEHQEHQNINKPFYETPCSFKAFQLDVYCMQLSQIHVNKLGMQTLKLGGNSKSLLDCIFSLSPPSFQTRGRQIPGIFALPAFHSLIIYVVRARNLINDGKNLSLQILITIIKVLTDDLVGNCLCSMLLCTGCSLNIVFFLKIV